MQSVPLNKTLPDTKIDNGIWNPCSSLWDQGIDWQDISNWRGHEVGGPRPERPRSSDWTNKSGEVIVDAQDKETWPTIGDKSEATLDGGDSDSASVKSVISSSSAPSQGHGDTSGQGSAMQGQNQSSSSLWGMTSMNSNADAKIDSENSWGIAPQTSVGSSMWDSSSSIKTAGQSTSMQGIPNGISTSGSISNVMPTSTNSTGGWGDSLPGDGTYPGNNSGAQNETGSGQSSSFGSAMWQGIRNMSGGSLSNIDNKEAASQGSGWGSQSSSSSVIGSGLSISASSSGSVFNAKGVSAMNQENADVGQWGQSSTTSAGGGDMWGGGGGGGGAGSTASTGSFENRNTSNKPEATGWGSPSPSPIPNAGTEGWGQPDQKKEPPQAWGQVPTSTTGWDQRRRPSSSGWEETGSAERRPVPGWGSDTKTDTSGNWAQNRPAPSAWGPSADTKASQSQWGSSGASGPQSQWPDSSASQATTVTTNASQIGAWGSGNPMTAARPPQPPRPIGTQVPPTQGPHPSLPSQQQQPQSLPQPGSWAEAAGRGLTAVKPSPVGSTTRKLTKEDLIAEAINTPENWGKVPVRQDSSWDKIEDSPKLPRKPLGSSSSSTGSQEDLHWNQPNNGTAIWESAKEPTTSPSVWDRASAGASGSSSEWGVSSDNDGGTWNGDGSQAQQAAPQTQDSNMWQGPPPNTGSTWNQPPNRSNSNTWVGNDERPGSNSWSSGSSGSNDSKKNWQSNPPPAPGQPGQVCKSDNVWDRNGTSLWGDPDKTETGTWGADGMRRNSGSASWDREPETGQWGQPDNSNRTVEPGASYWGNPDRIPGHWNNPNNPSAPVAPHAPQPITGRPPSEKLIWGQTVPPSKPGWGDTSPPGAREEAAMWNQTARPAGWGDNQWQKRNPPTSSWGEANDWNAINATRKPPQRSRMLQQLMDMGFKKEDAQNALIRNDMDLDRAISDLVASAKRPEYDADTFRGRQLKGMGSCEDLADTPVEFLPPPNTLTNAQGLHNTQVIASPYAKQGPSLPHMSSLTAPSINPLQKLLPQQLSKPPVPGQPAQPIRGQLPNQTQQMIQAQIVQQLQMAVQAGLISPQLLNQHLTPAMLVMLQQLLQLQQLYQQLVAQQQVLQQNKAMAPPLHQRSQLEQVSLTITKIKQKIAQVQQALAKQAGCQQPAPAGIDPNKELLKDLQADISNLHLKDNPIIPPQQPPQHGNQPGQQSRLTQWKLPSPDKDLSGHLTLDLNRAPGSRPIGPHSTPPNLQNKLEPGVSFTDPWSSSLATVSTVWPSTSTTVTTTAALPHTDTKTNTATADDKESSGNQSKQCSEDQSAAGANSTNPATPTSSAALDIEEFVPGKPWQGIVTKSVDDDPNLTPGQVAMRRPLSINTIKDEYVMSTLGKSSSSNSLNSSPTVSDGTTTSSSWSSAGGPTSLASSASSPNLLEKSTWSATPSESAPGVLASSDIWGMSGVGAAKNRRPPPGLINRSIDGGTVKNLCVQQGSLQTFLHSAQYGQAYVCYKSREDAIKAQKSLNALVFGNTAIIAEFVNDAEVARLQELSGTNPVAPHSSGGSPHWSQQPLHSGLRPGFGGPKFEQAAHLNGAANFGVGVSSSGSMWGSGGSGGLWGPIEEHADNHMLPGGLLGGH
ncbi:hypothetical protein LSH36_129g01128 [Paralvinella palmiformis]|uniref:UBA domain-containing protein n=1 Tax=Paralvinella palmiformis TaxID=53620 RepID=A0AAD9JWL4_9ANNE|nr:hypothetical protein LSH36_129g01128 [Paralvinella palmiformis]